MNLRMSRLRNSKGQSLLETALIIPLLMWLVLNVVNLAYFFLVAINLSGSSRTSALYSITGSATPSAAVLPPVGGASTLLSVTYLAYQDMTGALWNPTGATVQVCSPILGINATGSGTVNQVPNCQRCTSSACNSATGASIDPSLDKDPEAPSFVLNQVAIIYTFPTLFPGRMFNLPLAATSLCNSSGSCTFTRYAEMRAMN